MSFCRIKMTTVGSWEIVCVWSGYGSGKRNELNRQEVHTLWNILHIQSNSERNTYQLSKSKMTTSSVACRLFKQSSADPVRNRLLCLHYLYSSGSKYRFCSSEQNQPVMLHQAKRQPGDSFSWWQWTSFPRWICVDWTTIWQGKKSLNL